MKKWVVVVASILSSFSYDRGSESAPPSLKNCFALQHPGAALSVEIAFPQFHTSRVYKLPPSTTIGAIIKKIRNANMSCLSDEIKIVVKIHGMWLKEKETLDIIFAPQFRQGLPLCIDISSDVQGITLPDSLS
jgi:hypothetical protein